MGDGRTNFLWEGKPLSLHTQPDLNADLSSISAAAKRGAYPNSTFWHLIWALRKLGFCDLISSLVRSWLVQQTLFPSNFQAVGPSSLSEWSVVEGALHCWSSQVSMQHRNSLIAGTIFVIILLLYLSFGVREYTFERGTGLRINFWVPVSSLSVVVNGADLAKQREPSNCRTISNRRGLAEIPKIIHQRYKIWQDPPSHEKEGYTREFGADVFSIVVVLSKTAVCCVLRISCGVASEVGKPPRFQRSIRNGRGAGRETTPTGSKKFCSPPLLYQIHSLPLPRPPWGDFDSDGTVLGRYHTYLHAVSLDTTTCGCLVKMR